jgi:hypothetical protein
MLASLGGAALLLSAIGVNQSLSWVAKPKTTNASGPECFTDKVIPYVLYIDVSFGAAATGDETVCPPGFVVTLLQALSVNGRGNVVLLEGGHTGACAAICSAHGARYFRVPAFQYGMWKARLEAPPRLHTIARLEEREPGWRNGSLKYFVSYWRIYAIAGWLRERPCVTHVAHIDVDTLVWASAASVASWFPHDQLLATMHWPMANHIYTSATRSAFQDLVDFMDAGFDDLIGQQPLPPEQSRAREFTSDMHALASYVAYNATHVPCWGWAAKLQNPGPFCDHFDRHPHLPKNGIFRTPYVRPSHAPQHSVGNLAWPRCQLDECAMVGEALHLAEREGLNAVYAKEAGREIHGVAGGVARVRWIKCAPHVLRLNEATGRGRWVRLWAMHMQGHHQALAINYWRPQPEHPLCAKEDCMCEIATCSNCARRFRGVLRPLLPPHVARWAHHLLD